MLVTHVRKLARIAGWHILVPMLRARARRRVESLEPGQATVVTVNWNSWEHLSVLIDVVVRRSPTGTKVLVVDNGSEDTSQLQLVANPAVTIVKLPVNLGHDLALDIGVLLSRTEYVVTLDVDAFPLHDHWLRELLAPLDADAQISGARLNRQYVHPCCCAMRTARFVTAKRSFRGNYQPRRDGRDASGEVGEDMSADESPHLHFFEVTSQRGPKDVGTVFGGLVYHNFYATRFRATTARQLDGTVKPDDAERAWDEALRRYVL